ncbi:hypothetical protein NERG_02598 [Nematocida ausubeli]|uniref:Uncharacterized protein n=1 Tax=Nematocida ausubeli (strain ATCC PRA-371 / ERTm2) TaxID=1913371 RepID=H8ZG77_NEMA1|nr:hypothetical protein NERG_02598 [Nematocida ausubeli]
MNMEMKRKTHECLYKRNNSQISIKLLAKVLLMGTLMGVQNVFGLLTREDMVDVLKVLLSESIDSLGLKLDGPFNPVMLYVYREIDVISNKRFNPHYINKQTAVPDKENILQNIDRTNDTVREEDSEGNKTPKSTLDHYSALINMFPSPAGKVSIYPKKGCKDSFTSFLKSDPVKEYAHKILAMLLLRTEGMVFKLEVKDEESECPRLVYTNQCKPEQSFSVPIDIASAEGQDSNSSNEGANIKKINRKLLQTIKYFLNAESSQKLEESIALKESAEKEVYWKNEFTKTPTWLMRSYIYYYLETKEDAIEFCRLIVQTGVFFVTESMITDNYNTSLKVFSKLVTRKDAQTDALKQWEKVKKLEDAVESAKRNRLLPFRDNSQLPAITEVEADAQGNTESDEELISSDIESVLLTLLCCFVYAPETNTYNVDKISRAQEEVKNLFGMPSKNTSTSSDSSETSGNPDINNPVSNNTPVIQVGQKIPQEVQKKWFGIIKNLVKGDEDISYITMGGRRMIQPDIFNILIIIIKLIGIDYDGYKEEIQKYRDRLQNLELTDESYNYNVYHFIQETEGCAYEIFSQIKRECREDKSFAEWLLRSSKSSKSERTMYVDFMYYDIRVVNNTKHLLLFLMIYYGKENTAKPIGINFFAPGKVHLGVGNRLIKPNNSGIVANLKKEIAEMPKDSYSMCVLSKYAEALETWASDDVMVDEFYISAGEKLESLRHSIYQSVPNPDENHFEPPVA